MLTSCLRNSFADTFQYENADNRPREQSLQSFNSKPPLSPWTSIADPDEMLFEASESQALEDASDDGRELSISVGINEHNEEVTSECTPWEDENGQEKEHIGNTNVLGHGNLAAYPVESQCSVGYADSNAFQDVSKSPSTCATSSQATSEIVEPLEEDGEHPPPERHLGLRISTKTSYFLKPSIVVSNNVNEEFAARKLRGLPESSSTFDSSMVEVDMDGDAAPHLCKIVAPFQPRTTPGDFGRYSPNNYEIATQDRHSPHIPGGIDPLSKRLAAARLHVFCVDADSITGDAATSQSTSIGPSHVKRLRTSDNHPEFQTPKENYLSLQQWQGEPPKSPTTSAVQDHLQVPSYPTPPLSSKRLPQSQHRDSSHDRCNTPTSSHNSPIEPWSPVSPSPPSLPEVDDGFIRCHICPTTRFAGPHQKNSLQRHIRDKHGGMPRLRCLVQECRITIAPGRKDNVLKHVRALHPDYPLPPQSTKRKRKADSD